MFVFFAAWFSIAAFAEGLSDVSENCKEKIISSQSSVTSTLALATTESTNNVATLPELRQSSEPKCLSNLMTPDDFSSSNEKNETDSMQKSPLLPPVSYCEECL